MKWGDLILFERHVGRRFLSQRKRNQDGQLWGGGKSICSGCQFG